MDRTLTRPFCPNLLSDFARVDMLGLRVVERRPQRRPVRVPGGRHEAGAVVCPLALRAALVYCRPGAFDVCDALGAQLTATCGLRAEPGQWRTIVDPSLGHGQHPRQRGHPGRHEGRLPTRRTVLPPATKHVALAALRRGRLPQLQELHPDAGERHSCPLRPRRLVRRRRGEQGLVTTVFGRMGSSLSHGPLREEQGVDDLMASLACPQRCPLPRSRRRGRATPFPRRSLLQAHRAGAATAEASDDEDDAPVPDAAPEPELIGMPPAPVSAPPMSNLERCIALRLVYGAEPR